jgi:hypothetical protein
MLRRSAINFPRRDKNYDEIKYVGRRLKLFPTENPFLARQENFVDRFKEVGPDFSRVWLSLGPQYRRRRVGRDRDFLDKRYYWRPIPRGIQNLYWKELRRVTGHYHNHAAPLRLFAPNSEIGTRGMQGKNEGNLYERYGGEYAAEVPFDWEYRVY